MLQALIQRLVKELKKEFLEIKENNFQFPGKFGDISCNICFIEAKKKTLARKGGASFASQTNEINPGELALEVIKKIKLPEEFEKIEEKKGYLNFYFNYKKLGPKILEKLKTKPKTNKKIMIEFSNPNPCKAMHIGHARTTFLGDSIARILEFHGNEIVRANYYNNLGKQVAKEIIALQKYGIKKMKKIDHEFAEIYAKLHKETDEKELNSEAQKILFELENKTGKFEKEWGKIVDGAISGFEETYKNLGIKFDVCLYENEFKEEGKKIAKELLKKDLAFEHDDSVVIDLEKYNLTNTVLSRADGTSLYLTSDLALTIHKFKEFNLTDSIWVVGSEQNLHFRQLFKILEILGYKWTKNCKHMSYGIVTLLGSKMSSRGGEYILIDDLVDEIIEKAKQEVKNRNPDLEETKISKIAKKIGIGALKYDILKVDRNKNEEFNPNKAIKFEGNTGPYLQYMVVRCNSILRNTEEKKLEVKEINDYELELLKKFPEFSGVVEKSGGQLKPNLICNYAFELATIFSGFYENCKVIGSEEESFRLGLVKKTREVLEICLGLLGIEVPELM